MASARLITIKNTTTLFVALYFSERCGLGSCLSPFSCTYNVLYLSSVDWMKTVRIYELKLSSNLLIM